MPASLRGKVAIVTGASKGIGAEIAKQLAAAGAAVVVNYSSSRDGAEKVVREILSKDGKAVAVQANVSKKSELEKLFDETKKNYGRIDILVNNAGVYEFLPLEQVTESHFHKQFDTNVLGLILASQLAAKFFDPKTGGSIINISSAVSTFTPPTSSVYTATKAAVDAITKVLAKELGPRKIRVNSINPGMIVTEGLQTAGFEGGDFQKSIEATAPLRRVGQVGDIAPAAVFLASDDSAYMTGESLFISGGIR